MSSTYVYYVGSLLSFIHDDAADMIKYINLKFSALP